MQRGRDGGETKIEQTRRKRHSHLADSGMGHCTANLDGDDEVHRAHGDLEGLEADIFIWEDPVLCGFCGVVLDGDTGGDSVVRIWTEPGIALGLLEDVVEEGVVSVVIHCSLLNSGSGVRGDCCGKYALWWREGEKRAGIGMPLVLSIIVDDGEDCWMSKGKEDGRKERLVGKRRVSNPINLSLKKRAEKREVDGKAWRDLRNCQRR